MVRGQPRIVLSGSAQAPGRCAVLGHPIAHSLSPLLHRAAYAEVGVPWSYEAVDLDADQLPGFLAGLDSRWRGLSVTMPLKRAVLALVDELDPVAATVGVVNTVTFGPSRPGARALRRGANTDVSGFAAMLPSSLTGPVVILGAGATACSVLAALPTQVAVTVLARGAGSGSGSGSGEQVAAVAGRLGRAPVTVSDLAAGLPMGPVPQLLVATLPAGALGAAELGRLGQVLPGPGGTVVDVVYDGWPTPLARAAAVTGAQVLSGLDLLVHQAVGQVALMTGSELDTGRLTAVLADALVGAGVPGAPAKATRL